MVRRRFRVAALALLVTFLALAGGAQSVGAATDSDNDQLTNTFENQNGFNPNAKDSDHDGLRDAAEDPDGDRLSNLGEQRFGTSPLKADTDNDGTSDFNEDSNHNGTSNGLEQDRRHVPSGLKPSLSTANKDQPASYRDGCHSKTFESAIHPCAYGDKQGSRTIAIFGDSHVAQWLPGLAKAGNAKGWKIISITKSACPSVDVKIDEPAYPGAYASCRQWRNSGEAWFRQHKPDLIIISNWRDYPLLDSNGDRISAAQHEAAWKAGLGRTLDDLPAASELVVLGDTPLIGPDVPKCLSNHLSNMSACSRRMSSALEPVHDSAEETAAEAHGASFTSLTSKVCSYDPCPLVINELLVWRSQSHVTATYAKQLSPSLIKLVGNAIG
jgi:hypothetical protein